MGHTGVYGGYGLEGGEDVGLGCGGVGVPGCLFGFAFGAELLVEGPLFFEDLFEVFLAFFSFVEVLGDEREGPCSGSSTTLFDGGGGVGVLFLAAAGCSLRPGGRRGGVRRVWGRGRWRRGGRGPAAMAAWMELRSSGLGRVNAARRCWMASVELGVPGLGVLFWERPCD